MSPSALGTDHAADPETKTAFRGADSPVVVAVDRKACRMPAGAFQLVKLKGAEHGIIVFLRINVANISRYGYHEFALPVWPSFRGACTGTVVDSRQLFQGWACCSFYRQRSI